VEAGAFVWSIAAPPVYLRRASDEVSIDRRGVQPSPAGLPDALNDHIVEFPSYFCREPAQFLGLLAYFLQRGIRFELALTRRDPDSGDVLAFTRVFPRFDEATFKLLMSFDPAHAAEVADRQAQVAEALERLRRTVSGD
jgi:hypothetical protein